MTSYEPVDQDIPDSDGGGGRPVSVSLLLILGGTAVSGIAGYVVTWLVYRVEGAGVYGVFSVLWSALFLVVGVLFGIQQEATRAVASRDPAVPGRTSLWSVGVALSVAVALVVLATSVLWAPGSLGSESRLVVVVAIGAALDGLVVVASGVAAGSGWWWRLALLLAVDGSLRVAGVGAVLAAGGGIDALAVAVVAPFLFSVLLVVATAPRGFARNARVAETVKRLIANCGRTMLAAAATAVLINGFPLILSYFSGADDRAHFGSLILAITLTRAPVLVPLTALSSFLVARFARRPEAILGRATRLLLLVAGTGAVLALAAALWGRAVLQPIFGAGFDIGGPALGALVAAAVLIGELFVSGAAVLALHRHGAYAVGWVIASVVTVAALFVPLELTTRAAVALIVGPLVGLAVHVGVLARGARR